MTTGALAIEGLAQALDSELKRDRRGPRVAELLRRYAQEERDWHAFARFERGHYTRNLMAARELFELLLICWNPGQASPIHNHQGQRCWMAVLDGSLEEQHFHHRPNEAEPLVAGDRKLFEPGGVAYISDEIALHEIRPSGSARGVSLHLYSLRIPQCQVYCPETGRVTLRQLGYDTVRDGAVPSSTGPHA